MAAEFKTGTFVKRTGTGTQSITGVGFQPKAVFFWWNNLSATGMVNGGARISLGFDDGTNHVGVGHFCGDDLAAADTSRSFQSTKSLVLCNLDQTIDSLGSISAFGIDGFTVDWTTAGGSPSVNIHYLAIGGTGVSAQAGYFTSRGGTGLQTVEGVGFSPSVALFLNALWTSSASSAEDAQGPATLGVAVDGGGEWLISAGTVDNSNPAQTSRYQVSDACISRRASVTTGLYYEASYSGSHSDGFTVNWSLNPNTFNVPYLALSGVTGYAGSLTQPAATGQQVTSVTGMRPLAVLFASVGGVASASEVTQHRLCVGATDGTAQNVVWTGDEHNVSNTRGARYGATDAVVASADSIDADGATTTLTGLAELVSLNDDSFTLDWTTTDGTAREVMFLALGPRHLEITIDVDDINPLRWTFAIQATANGLDTMTCDIETDLTVSPVYRPTIHQEITVTEDGTRIFAGYITSVQETGLDGPNGTYALLRIAAADYTSLASRRYITATLTGTLASSPGTTLAEFLQDEIITDVLDDYGVTLHPSQADGPALQTIVFEYVQVASVLDQLAETTGWVWGIDYDKQLRMWAPGSLAAPFNINEDDATARWTGDVEAERTLDDRYANRVTVRWSNEHALIVSETFEAGVDGVTAGGLTTYTAQYPATQNLHGTWPNGLPGIGPVLWAGPPDFSDVVWEFTWDPMTNPATLVHDDANFGTTTPGTMLPITYQVRFPLAVTANDSGEQALYGIWEYVELVTASDEASAQAVADAILAERVTAGELVVRYNTRRTGLLPGQSQTITAPTRDISGEFLITDVNTSVEPGSIDDLIRTVTATQNLYVSGNWRQLYKDWLGGSAGTSGGTSTVSAAGTTAFAPTYLTEDDETTLLENSRQLVAGDNITLDTTTPGQMVISAADGGSPGGSPGSGDFVQLDERSPSGTGVVSFSSLGSYTHLKIVFSARGTQAATNTAINITVNGDTGSNYDREVTQATATTLTAAEGIGSTAATIINISAGSAPAGAVGTGEIMFHDYRGTTFFKGMTSVWGLKTSDASGGMFTRTAAAQWRSTSAITSITLTLASGNYVAGSKFTLYGLL